MKPTCFAPIIALSFELQAAGVLEIQEIGMMTRGAKRPLASTRVGRIVETRVRIQGQMSPPRRATPIRGIIFLLQLVFSAPPENEHRLKEPRRCATQVPTSKPRSHIPRQRVGIYEASLWLDWRHPTQLLKGLAPGGLAAWLAWPPRHEPTSPRQPMRGESSAHELDLIRVASTAST